MEKSHLDILAPDRVSNKPLARLGGESVVQLLMARNEKGIQIVSVEL